MGFKSEITKRIYNVRRTQLVEVLRYKPKGSGFESRW